MTSEQKPREFWIKGINTEYGPTFEARSSEPQKWPQQYLKVVEYIALEQAQATIERQDKDIINMFNQIDGLQARIAELQFQRNYWHKQFEVLEIKNREPLATMRSTKDSI